MTFTSLMINGTEYYIIGKIMFKLKEEEPLKLTVEEKKLVKDKLERNKQDIFKSKKLNEIAKINQNLKRVDIFEEILDKIENIIPEELRDTYYENLKKLSLNLSFVNILSKEFGDAPGGYTINNNTIIIYTSFDKHMPQEVSKEIINAICKIIFTHELIHMASSKYNNETKEVISGFASNVGNEKSIKNNAINEGFTQMLTESIYKPTHLDIFDAYPIEKRLAKQIFYLTDRDALLKGYFKEKNIDIIEKELQKIIDDKIKSFCLINILDKINTLNGLNENYKTIELAESIILDYYAEKLKLLSLENNYFEIDKLISSLEESIILSTFENGKKLETDITNLNIDKYNSIINEYKSHQRKRQMN